MKMTSRSAGTFFFSLTLTYRLKKCAKDAGVKMLRMDNCSCGVLHNANEFSSQKNLVQRRCHIDVRTNSVVYLF